MNFYTTSGTADFMEKLANKHSNQQIIVLYGNGNAVLLHESEKKSVFATPRKFEVIDGNSHFDQFGYYAIHSISFTDEGRHIFEEKWLQQSDALKNDPTLRAYRFLRPIKSDIYLIITQWTGPASYEVWKNSYFYQKNILPLMNASSSVVQSMYNGSNHVNTYTANQNK